MSMSQRLAASNQSFYYGVPTGAVRPKRTTKSCRAKDQVRKDVDDWYAAKGQE